jgi:hypothetical protein
MGDGVRLAKEFGLSIVRHFEMDETIANADYVAPAGIFRQLASEVTADGHRGLQTFSHPSPLSCLLRLSPPL